MSKKLQAKDIKGSDYNPRTMSEPERQGLSVSIEEFGNLSGITFNKKNLQLVTGHRRYAELCKRCEDQIKLVPLEVKSQDDFYLICDKDEKFTGFFLRVVDWDDKKEVAGNVTANSHTVSGKFDHSLLSTALDRIDPELKLNLRLDQLEIDLGLDFEAEFLEKKEIQDKEESEILSNITIKCKMIEKEEVILAVKDMLLKHNFENVTVNG